jgi:hypothetical protein
VVQTPLSGWWLERFRFGPMEYLWRLLTYGYGSMSRAPAPAAMGSMDASPPLMVSDATEPAPPESCELPPNADACDIKHDHGSSIGSDSHGLTQ